MKMAKSGELKFGENSIKQRDGFGDRPTSATSPRHYVQQQQYLKSPTVFTASDEESPFTFVLSDVNRSASGDVQDCSFVELRKVGSDVLPHQRSAAPLVSREQASPGARPEKLLLEGGSHFPPDPETMVTPNRTPSTVGRSTQPPSGRTAEWRRNLIDFGSPPHSPPNKLNFIGGESRQTHQYGSVPVSKPKLESPTSDNSDSLAQEFSQLNSDLHDDMEAGSLVEVSIEGRLHFGVVRWCGKPKSSRPHSQQILVGVELESEIDEGTDGSYWGHQYFDCPYGRGVFVPLRHCRMDSRFSSFSTSSEPPSSACYNGYDVHSEVQRGPECPTVVGQVPPIGQLGDLSQLTGKFRGIQGHHNSCYLDATLFSMFTFTSIFDGLLFRPPTRDDIPQYEAVQRILREEIVNPLRQNYYVGANKVMELRRLLQELSSVTGLTNEEKDPEEFLHCLLSQTLRAEPFLKLNSGQEAYHHQLFVEKDDKLVMPTVQQLFEQSFLSSGIKLKEVPPTLIIQMPRFGKSYKMYPYVLPSSLLDITDVLENSPRQCIVCGHLAEMECQQCLGQCGTGLESISFCSPCLLKVHSHKKRTTHKAQPLQVPADFAALQEHCAIPRMYMELFAVVCIATSHYVAFVKCGPGPDAPWCFFDSMADRKGEQNGFNIPEVMACPDLPRWLSDDWDKQLLSNSSTETPPNSSNHVSGLPDHVRRLFSDAYMCLYQSPDLMLYR